MNALLRQFSAAVVLLLALINSPMASRAQELEEETISASPTDDQQSPAVESDAAAPSMEPAASPPTDQNDEHDQAQADERLQRVIVVVGAPGLEAYDEPFRQWAANWRRAAEQAGADFASVGLEGEGDVSDRDRLRGLLLKQAERDDDLLWIVLIGHGTFDSKVAKFNLRGPDVSAAELGDWLKPIETPTAVINCASSSAPFINQLTRDNRAIVTATKSGFELNYARYGRFLSEAIVDPQADLDKDDQVSLLEAFLTASRRVEEFYAQESRLATEHALLDDNGDGQGTPAAWFRGVRATKRAQAGAALDGLRAHQIHLLASDRERRLSREVREQRDELERQIEALREEKPKLTADDYYARLETLLVELARLYQSAEQPAPANEASADKAEAAPSPIEEGSKLDEATDALSAEQNVGDDAPPSDIEQ